MRIGLLAGASIGALSLCSSAFAQSPGIDAGRSKSAASQPQDTGAVAEVIVTASRRSESVKNTPIAVTALGGDALQDAQAVNLADVAAMAPNVQISTYNNNGNVTIRGIGNSQINAGADAGVAVHQDGVYIGQAVLTLATLNDVQRIEVLRGPQGTLFGRNATGGAINVIPNRPTDELSYGAEAAFGLGPDLVRSSAYLSGPLAGGLRGRVSVQQNYNEGFTKNLVPTSAQNPVPKRLDGVDSLAIRGQLEAETGALVTRLSLEFMKDTGAGPSQWLSGTPTGVLPGVLVGAPLGDVGDREVFNNYGLRDNEAKFATLVSTLGLGGGELKVTASYGETRIESLTDGDGTGVDHTSTYALNDASQTYGEVIYASDDSRALSFIVGANYFREKMRQDISVPISILPPPLDVLGAVRVDLGADALKSISYAGFGEAQYRFSDALRIFGGVRATHDQKSMLSYNNFGVSPAYGKADWSEITYEFGASYRLTPDMTAYAKYGTGFKGGGFSAGAAAIPFDPETNTNLEAGLKWSYLDGSLQANLAAFHMKYKDLQVNQIVGPLVQVKNAARATINGVEVETTLRPVAGLRLELNGAWLDAKFDEFLSLDDARPTLGMLDLSGNTLATAPKYSFSAGAYYETPAPGGTLTLGARYDWKSRVYFSEFNLPLSSQQEVGKLNLYLRFESEDERWHASLFALNVTDEQVKENVVVVSSLIGSLGVTRYQPSRQIGVSVGYKY